MKTVFVTLITLALALTACGDGGEDLDVSSWPRPDGDWELAEGAATVDGYPITLSIDGTGVSGRAACNSYGGVAVVNGSAVSLGELSQTAMGCEPAVMEAEAAFLSALQAVQNFRFDGERLVLTGTSTDLVFRPVQPVPTSELIGTPWVLETLIEGETASSVAGEPATLLLAADGTLTASTGCRALTGSWLANGAVIVVPELSAEGDCPDDLWKQDSLVVTVVGDEFRAEVEGDQLTLTSMGGDGLVYRSDG
ncbi:MAG: META domain-containing protein [Acidimicrobiia bacterium]|nr:META domain-containing protein [Acidimicrobiia bacterium]